MLRRGGSGAQPSIWQLLYSTLRAPSRSPCALDHPPPPRRHRHLLPSADTQRPRLLPAAITGYRRISRSARAERLAGRRDVTAAILSGQQGLGRPRRTVASAAYANDVIHDALFVGAGRWRWSCCRWVRSSRQVGDQHPASVACEGSPPFTFVAGDHGNLTLLEV